MCRRQQVQDRRAQLEISSKEKGQWHMLVAVQTVAMTIAAAATAAGVTVTVTVTASY
jgi:hypothetical protein